MLKGSGKYMLQRLEKGATNGFYECVGIKHQAHSSLTEKKLSKKKPLVDHFIFNVGGGNLGYDLRPQLSKSAILTSQDVQYDEMSQDRIDID